MFNRRHRTTVSTRIGAVSWESLATLIFGLLVAGFLLPAPGLADEKQPEGVSVTVGESRNIRSHVAASLPAGQPVVYESGNAGFFTVDEAGTITGVHEGVSAVAISTPDGTRVEVRVEVKPAVPLADAPPPAPARAGEALTGIVIGNAGGEIEVGGVQRIVAYVLPYQVIGANPFDITSSDPAVLRVVEHARVIEAVGEGEAVITATTPDGAHTATVSYTVVPQTIESHPAEKTYTLEAGRFGIVFDDASEAAAKANSAGLYQALLHTADNGFTRLLLPENSTLYVEPRDTIHMVSNVQLDLNGSEIKLRPNDYPRYVAFLFAEKAGRDRVLENASIVNGTITGERDEKEAYFPNWAKTPETEAGCTIVFDEGRNNGIRDLTVRKSIGFNISSGLGSKSFGVTHFAPNAVSVRNMEQGDFDDQGGAIDAKGKIRTKEPMDVTKLKSPHYTLGYPLGYMGYPYMNSRIYDAWFYDADMNLLTAQRGKLRFRQYDLPEEAAFVHLSFYHDGVPPSGNSDFHSAFAFIENRANPINHYMINCVIEDNYSTGFAACGGQGWLIKDNVFRRNGGRMPGCDIDWEDGWEYMQGDLIEGNTFESRLNVITCAGIGLVFRNNTFRGESIFYGRTQHYSIIDNLFEKAEGDGAHAVKVSYASQSDIYAVGNTYRNASVGYTRQHSKQPFIGTYEAIFVGETFDQSQMLNGHVSRMTDCVFSNAPENSLIQADVLDNCTIEHGSYLMSGAIINSTLANVTFRVVPEKQLIVRDSTLTNPGFSVSGTAKGVVIDNCRITIERDLPLVTPNGLAEVVIRDAQITLTQSASPWGLIGGWDATDAAAQVTIDNVSIKAPAGVDAYIHKFAWYPPADAESKITYKITGTDLSGIRQTDEKGEKSNAVFEIAR